MTDDPRWTVEGWCPLPGSSGKMQGKRYQCQHCSLDGRAIIHNGTTHYAMPELRPQKPDPSGAASTHRCRQCRHELHLCGRMSVLRGSAIR